MKSWQENIILDEMTSLYLKNGRSLFFFPYSNEYVAMFPQDYGSNKFVCHGKKAICPTSYIGYIPRMVTTRTLFKILMGV